MITTTWTTSPADLLGLGSLAVRPCTGIEIAVNSVLRAPVTSVYGTGLPFGGSADLMTAQVEPATTAFAHNYIAVNDGTPLGIHPSGRPTS
jgi:hypothetical protein